MSNYEFYKRVFNHYNKKNQIRLAFAYGSAVFKQLNNITSNSSNSIVDFVFIVDDAIKFHDINLKSNSKNYSFLKYFGPYYISKIQNQYGAACYYNTLVKFEDNFIKYGVMQTNYFLKDLFDWDYLYISGRLHKPVRILNDIKKVSLTPNPTPPTATTITSTTTNSTSSSSSDLDRQVSSALNTNLKNALHTALLMLPETFTLEELFTCICNLSYQGDVRMSLGVENKNKVNNIIKPNFEHFYQLYKPLILKETIYLHLNENTMILNQDLSSNGIHHNLYFLPKNLIQTIIKKSIQIRQYQDTEEIIFKLATRLDVKEIIRNAVNNIVQSTSTSQTIKGLFTAGIMKSINYSTRKIKKIISN